MNREEGERGGRDECCKKMRGMDGDDNRTERKEEIIMKRQLCKDDIQCNVITSPT